MNVTNLEPRASAPKFLEFLASRGAVTVGPTTYLRRLNGHRQVISLNGEDIGELKTYQEPPRIVYVGIIPGIGSEIVRKGIRPTHPDRVVLGYCDVDRPLRQKGREDGWEEQIPFP